MSPDVSVRKKPRPPLLPPGWWRWPLRALAALLALVVALTTFAWSALKREQFQGWKDLEKVIAETDEKDPRWRWHEIQEDLEPIADDENSIFVIEKVAASAKGWNRDLKTAGGENVLDHSLPINRRLDAERATLLCDTLGKHEDCVALAASLAKHPRGRTAIALNPDVFARCPDDTGHCRSATAVLSLALERLLVNENYDDAAGLVCATAHVSAALRDDPFWFSQWSRVFLRRLAIQQTERLLARGELGDGACRRLANLFAAQQNDNPLLDALRGERAIKHELFENLYAGRTSLTEVVAPRDSTWECAQVEAYRYRLPEDHAFLLRRFNEFCDAARLPVEQRWPQRAKLNTRLAVSQATAQNQRRCLLAHYALFDVQRHPDYWSRCDAELSCAVVALAAERFRLAHKRWPASVNELCPAFLTEPPVDPFDGQPLRITKWADGLIVYSVGPDEQDDGGDLNKPDRGWPKDVGFRLFDPHLRGLSPLPRPVRLRFGGLVW